MTVTELLETVRRVELRTNRLVNDTMAGAYARHLKGRGMDFVLFPLTPALSLGEREIRFPPLCKNMAVCCTVALNKGTCSAAVPSPRGRGSG